VRPRAARRLFASLVLVASIGVSPAGAQVRSPQVRPRPWELSGGLIWARGFSLNAISGDEMQPNGSPFPLFTAQTRVDSAAGLAATLSRQLSGSIAVEADGSWRKPTYRTTVTADAEHATLVEAPNGATEFAIAGAVVLTLAPKSRLHPFVRVGGGWRRELSEDQTLSADGRLVMIGGGVKYWMGGRGFSGHLGVRADVGVLGRSGGLGLPGVTGTFRFAPAAGASVSLRF
jgi:hypothetical protein